LSARNELALAIGTTPAVAEVLAVNERLVAAARTSDAAVFDELLSKDLVVIMDSETTVLESAPKGSPWAPGATLHRRFTNVYRKENGEWRLIIKQSTVFSVE